MRAPLSFVAGIAVLLASAVVPAAASVAAVPLRPGTEQFLSAALEPGLMVSPLAIEGATLSGLDERAAKKDKDGRAKKAKKEKQPRAPHPEGMGLGPERARVLLRSLTVPGWGQATLGRRKSAAVFATAEVGIWATFASFSFQEQMRREAYRRTAQLGAGIDLKGRDEEFRRIVGAFISSEEYNLLVVSRDAANLYLLDVDNPDMDGYRAYIAKYSLSGRDSWNWSSSDQLLRYGAQRKEAQRAAIRANTMMAVAIANRLVSALHAARAAGRPAPAPAHSWRFEVTPAPGDDATAFRAALSTSF